MGLFKRIKNIFGVKVNKLVSKLENPIDEMEGKLQDKFECL